MGGDTLTPRTGLCHSVDDEGLHIRSYEVLRTAFMRWGGWICSFSIFQRSRTLSLIYIFCGIFFVFFLLLNTVMDFYNGYAMNMQLVF